MRTVDEAERRARLARRHRLAPGHRAADVVEAARSVVALHATDPATVHLAVRARVDGASVADVERALHDDRTLVRHLAMRRTLFVVPREHLPAVQAGASDRVAASERRRLVREVERAGLHADGERWLREAGDAVLAVLADGREATAAALRAQVPLLEGAMTYAPDRPWGGRVTVGPRVLTTLSAAGRIVRATNAGGWTTSRPRWAATAHWLGEEPERLGEEEGTARLLALWLRAFGPGTEADLRWWTGSTLTLVRRALAALDVVEVDLGAGRRGLLLADDVEPVAAVAPWAALLPSLDPTVMGWAERDWYVGEHREGVFDRNGNAGATAWWDGRIVGRWTQDAEGAVVVVLLEDVGEDGRRALEAEAQRLAAWLQGTRVLPRFPGAPVEGLRGPSWRAAL